MKSRFARHFDDSISVNVNINFPAIAKVRQIDARFDSEECSRQYEMRCVKFQIVDMSAVALGFLVHAVARSSAEIGAVTGVFDNMTDRERL